MWQLLLMAIATIRIAAPMMIFTHPIIATILSIAFDSVDGYVAFRARLTWRQYHRYDKLLDYWWYFWILMFSLKLPIAPIILGLFLFRSIGQILSLATHNPVYLFWFPNILEKYFVAYELTWIFPALIPLFQLSRHITVLIICTVIAIAQEYILHIKKICMGNYLFALHFHWKYNH